jgi:hypothetical protein
MVWRRSRGLVVSLAAAGAALLLGIVMLQIHGRPVADLLQPGHSGPTGALIARDFPDLSMPSGAGNDGQQFYAMARDPLHPTSVARFLDRPRYRLQRPGYPFLAWLLHPTGGGRSLVVALLLVNVIAAALTIATLGYWAVRHGRSPALGLFAIVLPGAFVSMRISCADLLAAGLALLAATLFLDGRFAVAAVLGVAAVLCKETSLILLVAVAASEWRRQRWAVSAFVAPALVTVAGIWLALAIAFPHVGRQYGELGLPLRGLSDSARYWRDAHDWKPALTVLGTLSLAFVALRHRLASPFAAATAAYLVVAAFQAMGTLAFWTSAPRTLYPLGLCSLAALLGRQAPPSAAATAVSEPRSVPA